MADQTRADLEKAKRQLHRSFAGSLASASLLVLAAASSPTFARDAAATREALALITETAGQICQSAPLEQTSEGYELSGDAQVKVGGIIGRIANIGGGVSGGGQYQTEKSVGVLQKDLVTAIQSGNSCKLEVFRTLTQYLLSPHGADRDASTPPPPVSASTQSTPSPPRSVPVRPDEVQVGALVQSLGNSEGSDRYYALGQAVSGLGPGSKIDVTDTLALLGGIRSPELRYQATTEWLLPRLITPVPPSDAVRLLSGFPSYERTELLRRIEPCIDRPIRSDTAKDLLNDVPSASRPSLALALDGRLACPGGLQAAN